jgi:glutamate formiminotransferase
VTLIAIPNVSAGRDAEVVAELTSVVSRAAYLLDVHSDADHDRTVFTVSGRSGELTAAMAALATAAAGTIDLTLQRGAHPRTGCLDVCPFVPHGTGMDEAIATAHDAARAIARDASLPVYLYGRAARRPEAVVLPELRRGGLEALAQRARSELPPDEGPAAIDPKAGVVCVGARDVLIAFNVWIDAGVEAAREIASSVRSEAGGLPGIRALGLWLGSRSLSQVSMNLVDPPTTGIDSAYDAVEREAIAAGVDIVATEIVGLVPERFMPDPDAQAARLLVKPGRSLESALRG